MTASSARSAGFTRRASSGARPRPLPLRARQALAAAWLFACTGGLLALVSAPADAADAPAANIAPKGAASATRIASAPAAPATAAIPAIPAAASLAATTFDSDNQVRFGRAALFRKLIPSPMLEAQAAVEFQQIVYGAQHGNQLYADSDPRVQMVQAALDREIPYALKWNDRARNWKWEIAVVHAPRTIRMYCLPGGKIVIYDGLFERVRPNPDEFGVLLGHEIAHALREHIREHLGEQQVAQLGSGSSVPSLFGLADLGEAPLGIGSQLVELRYSPADETEADVIGADIASRAGYDPRAALTLWDKLAAATRSDREQGFIYVHPWSTARRRDLLKRLADMLPLYAKATGRALNALPDYAGIGVPRRKAATGP